MKILNMMLNQFNRFSNKCKVIYVKLEIINDIIKIAVVVYMRIKRFYNSDSWIWPSFDEDMGKYKSRNLIDSIKTFYNNGSWIWPSFDKEIGKHIGENLIDIDSKIEVNLNKSHTIKKVNFTPINRINLSLVTLATIFSIFSKIANVTFPYFSFFVAILYFCFVAKYAFRFFILSLLIDDFLWIYNNAKERIERKQKIKKKQEEIEKEKIKKNKEIGYNPPPPNCILLSILGSVLSSTSCIAQEFSYYYTLISCRMYDYPNLKEIAPNFDDLKNNNYDITGSLIKWIKWRFNTGSVCFKITSVIIFVNIVFCYIIIANLYN